LNPPGAANPEQHLSEQHLWNLSERHRHARFHGINFFI